MNDPVAQAAAQIAADAAPSSTEPTGIVGELINEFHKLEEKVEHLIHPEAVHDDAAALAAAAAARLDGFATSEEVAALVAKADLGNVAGAAVAGAPEVGVVVAAGGEGVGTTVSGETDAVPAAIAPADTSATTFANAAVSGETPGVGELPNVTGATASQTASLVPSGIDITSTPASQGSGSNTPDTLTSQVSSTEPAGSTEVPNVHAVVADSTSPGTTAQILGASTASSLSESEVPNAAPAADVQPVTPASVPDASTLAGIPGIVVSSSEPLRTVGATASMIAACHIDKIRESIAAIKHHLSIRGFEQSAVQDIHAELEAIERWL